MKERQGVWHIPLRKYITAHENCRTEKELREIEIRPGPPIFITFDPVHDVQLVIAAGKYEL